MRRYTEEIKLVKNNRGVWDLDPFKGCEDGMRARKGGCWGLCYAAKIAKFRGYDFSKTVYRDFKNENDLKKIGKKIAQTSFIDGVCPPFVRLGVMCDPSFDWKHTLKIIEKIRGYNPNIVIITKHWKELKNDQLLALRGMCVNTSISALDTNAQIKHRLYWYNKLKKYCNSVLRVNTARFNDPIMQKRQEELLGNERVIDNILRIPKSHELVKGGVVSVELCKFLSTKVYASRHDNHVFFGHCSKCNDKCGLIYSKV